jgi:hypothetical protein
MKISFRGKTMLIDRQQIQTFTQLSDEIQRHYTDVDPQTIKLLAPGKGIVHLTTQPPNTPLSTLLLDHHKEGAVVIKMLASSRTDVQSIRHAKDLPGMPSFEHELNRELNKSSTTTGGPPSPSSHQPHIINKSFFGAFKTWNAQGISPPHSEALTLLKCLANDPGILSVMEKHRYKVGLLSEMPPAGKVGISPVCILGVNINKGQEISLRLRTDDCRGFRSYKRIKETLIHELAHMVHADHDVHFKELNSSLRKECDMADWTQKTAQQAMKSSSYSSTLKYNESNLGIKPSSSTTVMEQTAKLSGKTLSQLTGGIESLQKGDAVLYCHPNGSTQTAKLVSIDRSIIPPSYGVEMDGGTYRETEGSRLRVVGGIKGLGHHDAQTEADEERMRQLE